MSPLHTPSKQNTQKKAYAYHRDTRLPAAILAPTLKLLAESAALPPPPKKRIGHKIRQADIDRLQGLVEPIHEKWKVLEKRIKAQLSNGALCGITAMRWEQGLWQDRDYLHYRHVQGWVYHQSEGYRQWRRAYDARRSYLVQHDLWRADQTFRELEEARERYCDAVYLRYSSEDLGELGQILWDLASRAERLGPYCIGCCSRVCRQAEAEAKATTVAQLAMTPHGRHEEILGYSSRWPGPLSGPRRLDAVEWFGWVVDWAWGLRHDRERRAVGTDSELRRQLDAAEAAWQAEQAEPPCDVPDERGCLIPDDDEDDDVDAYEDDEAA